MRIVSCGGLAPRPKAETCAGMNYFYTEYKVIHIYSYQTLEHKKEKDKKRQKWKMDTGECILNDHFKGESESQNVEILL